MMDSALESTRVYWRLRHGWSEKVAYDPRPIKVIVREIIEQHKDKEK